MELWNKIKNAFRRKPDEVELRLLEQIHKIGLDLEVNYNLEVGSDAHTKAVNEMISLCNTLKEYKKCDMEIAKILIDSGLQATGTVAAAVIKASSNRRQMVDIYRIAKSGEAPIRKSDTNFL